jgi:hypothetical protein
MILYEDPHGAKCIQKIKNDKEVLLPVHFQLTASVNRLLRLSPKPRKGDIKAGHSSPYFLKSSLSVTFFLTAEIMFERQ